MRINRTTLAGAVLGVLGAALLTLFIVQTGSGGDEPTVAAYVADGDIAAGAGAETVRGSVSEAQVPESLAPASRITDLAEIDGQEVLRPIAAGEILTGGQLSRPGPAAGGLVVPAGYEALSVEAEPAPGVQGYVTPGDRVNVYATVEGEEGAAPSEGAASAPGGDGGFTQLVLGHVEVLAVTRGTLTGESQSPEQANAAEGIVLLLQVRPQDAPVLVHARRNGELWFSLVNPGDDPPPAERVDLGAFSPASRTEAIRQAAQARAQQPTDDQAAQAEGDAQPAQGATDG